MDILLKISSLLSNVFTIVASAIAIYLFIFKRGAIASAFKVLLNYSSHITLTELRSKLDRLNDLNADEASDKEEIVNIFNVSHRL